MTLKSANRIITKILNNGQKNIEDIIAIESPLEIRIKQNRPSGLLQKRLAVTMRTPGNDLDLIRGFLFTEGIIQGVDELINIKSIAEDVYEAELSSKIELNLENLDRNFFVSSSCGICGKASKENIETESPFLPWASDFSIKANILKTLRNELGKEQSLFDQTGGVHAVALISNTGEFTLIQEDVGRHNAMDKIIGKTIKELAFPLANHLVLVSGRASFELVQKAGMAGVPMLVAIGAPSSLAIDTAETMGMTLIGFLKSSGFNIYCGANRVLH